ncbi:MAG: LytR C-terminal domain-containing protein [Armatimonadetes bacterium]|nr:LytR C-terminal domain-containing protein [Armatimonadota bacterium]
MKIRSVAFVAMLLALCTVPLLAMPAAELQEMRVTRHIFTTQVLTLTGHIRAGDADKYRFVILRCEATRPTAEETRIFASDFVLAYVYPGDDGPVEQRAKIEAISVVGKDWDFGSFIHGTEPQVTVTGTEVGIGLAAYIENSVQEIELRRAGTDEVVTVDLSDERPRPYSVYVTSIGQQGLSAKVAGALVAAGFGAHTSSGLDNSITGCTVKYGAGLEEQAGRVRDIIKQELGIDARLVQMDDSSDVIEYDLVVWLGK